MTRGTLLGLLLIVLGATSLAAQSSTDIITGRVTGPAGEPLSGVNVRATSEETGVQRATLSNAQGRFTLVFPEGGGHYQLEFEILGMAPLTRPLMRIGDEEVLVAEVRMSVQAIALEGVDVTVRRQAAPNSGDSGGQDRTIPSGLLDRLPIDPGDLAAIAGLAPGVVILGDSLGGLSILGQGPDGIQFTLDGLTFDGGDLFGGGAASGVPQEAVRMTRVITSTYDVSRGQFSGGQIAGTTRGGTNEVEGSVNYALRDPALQWTAEDGPFAGAFRQNRISGGVGGPILRDRLFYFGSMLVQRRSEGLQSLLSADDRSLQRLGASPDSVGQYLSVLSGMGLHSPGVIAPQDRMSETLNLLGRVDFNITGMHAVTLRGDARVTEQDNVRAGALGLPQSGGIMENSGGGLMFTATSRFGNGWVNEFRAYGSENRRELLPYQILPQGRVRVSSDLEDGTRGITTLSFGGNSSSTRSLDRTLEVSNEISLLLGLTHRVRIGGMLNGYRGTQEIGNNSYGTFSFNSLADLEAGLPASFSRNLATPERESGGVNGAVYAGDTWRVTDRLQLTYGARAEASRVTLQPAYNESIEARFGYRTDMIPSELRVSPRVGFSYTAGGPDISDVGGRGGGFGRGGAGGMGGFGPGQATVIRGGFGEFRNRPSWGLFSAARDATGLPGGQAQIHCVGESVPFPDWSAYALDPLTVPGSCAGAPSPIPTSGRGTSVTVFDPGFGASRSWRASLGFQRPFLQWFGMTLDATYALGVSQQGVRDLNLNTASAFVLPGEGDRPVFAPIGAVVPGSGEIGLLASRIHRDMGRVAEVHSDLRSRTAQVTFGLSGMIPSAGVFVQTHYSFGRSRDQGSVAGWGSGGGGRGGAGAGGGANLGLPLTGGNPNEPDWGRSDFERRHSLTGTFARAFTPWLTLTMIGRATSGTPFTPMVGGDINGDGSRNDRAFIFDPATTADPVLAADMARLLTVVPGGARECLSSQLGRIAERNSCSSPWTYGLDMRAQIQPMLPGLDRRLSISVDASNTLVGLDHLLHGTDGLRGWGQSSRTDPVLLHPRGFDPGTRSFRYEVNERFGDSGRTGLAIRNPFQIQISARFAIGSQRGGFGGGRGAGTLFRSGAGGGETGGLATNPVGRIILLADSLGLEAEQVARLEAVSGSLQEQQEKLQAELVEARSRAGRAGPDALMRSLMPRIEETRVQYLRALEEAERILTPEQWERVPAELKQAPRMPGFVRPGSGGDGGNGGGRGGGGQRP